MEIAKIIRSIHTKMERHTTTNQRDREYFQLAEQTIEQHLDDSNLTVVDLCRKLATSQSKLYRITKRMANQSITAHIRSVRLEKSYSMLLHTDLKVTEVAYEVGFTDPNYFSRVFSKKYGMPPSAVRNSRYGGI